MRNVFYLLLSLIILIIVCVRWFSFKEERLSPDFRQEALQTAAKEKRQAPDFKQAAPKTAVKKKRQAPSFRQAALQTVAYLNDIPEVEGILLDPADNSTLFIEFKTRPSDFELILRAAAVHLSNKKKELTGASGILVYGTQGGMDFVHAFWMVHARYGKVDESESW